MPIFLLIQLCHISPWLQAYIPTWGGQQSVKIKGLDDRGGHEDKWICNRFIAVVKNLKVSKQSALTHLLKNLLENLLRGNNVQWREEGEHHLPRGHEKFAVWQYEKVSAALEQSLHRSRSFFFFKGTAVFVIKVQRCCCLCFIWTSPSALTTWTSPPVF